MTNIKKTIETIHAEMLERVAKYRNHSDKLLNDISMTSGIHHWISPADTNVHITQCNAIVNTALSQIHEIILIYNKKPTRNSGRSIKKLIKNVQRIDELLDVIAKQKMKLTVLGVKHG